MKLVPKWTLAVAAVLFFTFGFGKAAAQLLTDDQRHELIVLYDEDDATLPATAEDIVEALSISVEKPTFRLLRDSLGNPESARFLLSGRPSRAERRGRSIEDPAERLQRYVGLRFSDAGAVDEAKARLAINHAILSVEENFPLKMSAAITDPLYAPPEYSPWEYQWGLHDSWLNLALAWDRVHGTAYVGTVDTGVDSAGRHDAI